MRLLFGAISLRLMLTGLVRQAVSAKNRWTLVMERLVKFYLLQARLDSRKSRISIMPAVNFRDFFKPAKPAIVRG